MKRVTMKKFITQFSLIVSLFVTAGYANKTIDTNETNKTVENIFQTSPVDTNATERNATSILDINVSAILKQPKVEVDEENRTAEKEKLVEILTSGEENATEEDLKMAKMIAEKAVSTPTTQRKPDQETLGTMIRAVKDINVKIELLKTTTDTNQTAEEIKSIEESKNQHLAKIPTAITSQILDEQALKNYLTTKQDLRETIAKNEKKKESFPYIEASIKFANLELTEKFYGSLLMLEDMFTKGSKEADVKKVIQDTILTVQIQDYSKLKESIDTFKGKEEDNATLKNLYADLNMNKKTYEEVLNFLGKNTNLLAGNALFTGLNLKAVIDYINDLSPFDQNAINLGKIIPITLIMILLFSVRRMLANIIFFSFTIFMKDKKKSLEIRTQVVDLIKKPIGILLIAYGVDICLSIFYYPNPVPIFFNDIFDVIFIVLYAWLVIELIDGFGIMLLSKIAKKSSRKEVLNLIVRILYIIVVVVAFLMILARLGVNVSAIVASLGIGGLAVALATKDMIANLFASIMVLLDNSFSQGDLVVVSGVEGTVVETGLRKTALRTADNSLVFIPNSKIIDNNIINWSRRKLGRQIKMILEVNYATPAVNLLAAVNGIKEMLQAHPGIANPSKQGGYQDMRLKYRQNMVSLDDLAGYKNSLYVAVESFGESSINILVYCYTKTVAFGEFLEVRQDVILKIMEVLEKTGVSFAYPSQSVYIENVPAGIKIIADSEDELGKVEIKKENEENRDKNS